MTESWRAVVGFEGLYEVSDLGRVRSLPRKGTKGGLRKLSYNAHQGSGQVQVQLRKGRGRYRNASVHRLVLEAFVGPCPKGQECRHIDGDPKNNKLQNFGLEHSQGKHR